MNARLLVRGRTRTKYFRAFDHPREMPADELASSWRIPDIFRARKLSLLDDSRGCASHRMLFEILPTEAWVLHRPRNRADDWPIRETPSENRTLSLARNKLILSRWALDINLPRYPSYWWNLIREYSYSPWIKWALLISHLDREWNLNLPSRFRQRQLSHSI